MSGRTVPKRIWWLVLAGVGAVLVILPARWMAVVPQTYVRITEGEAAVDALIYQHVVPESLGPLKQTRPKDWSQRWPIANVPRHPLDLIESSSKPEPRLKPWIEAWQQAAWAGSEVGPAEREDLAELLNGSGLPALALLEGGMSFDLAGDEATAEVWFAHGVSRGEAELAELPGGDGRNRRLADALVGMQSVMWAAQNAGRTNGGATLERQAKVLLRILPPDDEQYGWAQICVADALFLQGHYDAAMRWLTDLQRQGRESRLTDAQRGGAAWAMGLICHASGRSAEAIPYLRQAAAAAGFEHRPQAARMLVIALASAGARDEAAEEMARHIRQYGLTYEEARKLAEDVRAMTPATFADLRRN